MRRAAARAARSLGAGWVDWEDVASDVLLGRLERAAAGGSAAGEEDAMHQVLRRASIVSRRERRRRQLWERVAPAVVRRSADGVEAGREGGRVVPGEEEERDLHRLGGLAPDVQEAVRLLCWTRSVGQCAHVLGVSPRVVWARARRALADGLRADAEACALDSPPPPGPLRDRWLLALRARGYVVAELAAKLGLSSQAVRTRLCRADRRLGRGPVTPPSGS